MPHEFLLRWRSALAPRWQRVCAVVGAGAGLRWLGIAAKEPQDSEVHPSAYFIRRCATMFVAFILWAALAPLDVASLCEGEIIPASQIKKVQHLEGGIVQEILVKDGSTVKAGQSLVVLQGASSQADTRELEARIGGFRIRIIRLEALLANGKRLKIPENLAKAFPEQTQVAHELFDAHRNHVGVAGQGQDHKITQRRGEMEENRSRIQNLMVRRSVLLEQVKINERLREQGLSSEYERLELQKELSGMDGQISESRAAVTRLQALLDEEKNTRVALGATDTEELKKDLDDSRKQLDELSERLTKYSDATRRTVIRAPVDGVVMTVYVRSQGEVVAPGGVVVSLVPGDDRMLAEVKLPVSDVGFVRTGQLARIQLSATVSRGFSPISGHVVFVSPDAVTQENKPPHFMVRIATDGAAFRNGAISYNLTPGVPVSASIVTGRRSVLMYLLDPLFGSMDFALSER